MTRPGDDPIVAEQIAYYAARAPEYDQWFEREGSFDAGVESNERWFAEITALEQALDDFSPRGAVLELASGTGWWTEKLARLTRDLTCVDASAETIDLARSRAPGARFIRADILSCEPERRYDVVFFSFWLSHVPAACFEPFWAMVADALASGGRAFFIDSYYERRGGFQAAGEPDRVVSRRLNDGREFQAIKNNYDPAVLGKRLATLGWTADVATTGSFFYYGTATRS